MNQPESQMIIPFILPKEYQDVYIQKNISLMEEAIKIVTENIGKDYLNESETKSYLRIGQDTLNDLLKQGLLTYSKIGRQKLYSKEDIKKCIDALKV